MWEWAREAYFGILSDQNEIENNTKRNITVCHLYWFLTSKRHNDFYLAGNIFTMISSSSNGPVPSLSKSLDASVGYMLCVEESTETASSQIQNCNTLIKDGPQVIRLSHITSLILRQ